MSAAGTAGEMRARDGRDPAGAARQRLFVGRDAELETFAKLVEGSDPEWRLLYVYGPGGVGKTTLMRQFAEVCAERQVQATLVDGRHVEPSPDAFRGVVNGALAGGATRSAGKGRTRGRRRAILVDTYERLRPIDAWLRDTFLPEVYDDVAVVVAGREPPSADWRADPRWRSEFRPLSLRNLDAAASRSYLARRDVPGEQHGNAFAFTHGHPLALALVADVMAQRPGMSFDPTSAPDVVKVLLDRLLQDVPGPAHRAALEAAALVRGTTEGLLGEMLAQPDVRELFDWLRGVSFVSSGPHGLELHETAQEALAVDLRWRNPEWYGELHSRARRYYLQRLEQASGAAQQQVLLDYIFLHRHNAVVRPFFEWQTQGVLTIGAMRADDEAGLVAMVERHEGRASAELAAHWLRRQPGGIRVLRGPDAAPAGFLAGIALHDLDAGDADADPGVAATARHLQRHGGLRAGETATMFRFWMAADTYQAVSPVQSLLFVDIVRHYLTTPGLAFTYIPCADPEFWQPVLSYAYLARLPEADFEVGGRRYGVYGHDWRTRPPGVWLELLAERELTVEPPAEEPSQAAPLLVLSEQDFAEAVRDALRDFRRPDRLAGNPLLRSRLVADAAGATADVGQRVAALRTSLAGAAAALAESPRSAKLQRALYHTYIQPAPTQEAAAELLDLPFSTYRRHLRAGIEAVTARLWAQELGEAGG